MPEDVSGAGGSPTNDLAKTAQPENTSLDHGRRGSEVEACLGFAASLEDVGAGLAPQPADLEDLLLVLGEEAAQAGAERAGALDREPPPPRRVLVGEPQCFCIAATVSRDAGFEDDDAGSHLDDRDGVPVAVRVDADHVVELICKHPSHLQPRLGEQLRLPVWG